MGRIEWRLDAFDYSGILAEVLNSGTLEMDIFADPSCTCLEWER